MNSDNQQVFNLTVERNKWESCPFDQISTCLYFIFQDPINVKVLHDCSRPIYQLYTVTQFSKFCKVTLPVSNLCHHRDARLPHKRVWVTPWIMSVDWKRLETSCWTPSTTCTPRQTAGSPVVKDRRCIAPTGSCSSSRRCH